MFWQVYMYKEIHWCLLSAEARIVLYLVFCRQGYFQVNNVHAVGGICAWQLFMHGHVWKVLVKIFQENNVCAVRARLARKSCSLRCGDIHVASKDFFSLHAVHTRVQIISFDTVWHRRRCVVAQNRRSLSWAKAKNVKKFLSVFAYQM